MKRFMVVLTGVIMAAALAACTPTKQSSEKRNNPRPEPHRSPLLTERLRNRRWWWMQNHRLQSAFTL